MKRLTWSFHNNKGNTMKQYNFPRPAPVRTYGKEEKKKHEIEKQWSAVLPSHGEIKPEGAIELFEWWGLLPGSTVIIEEAEFFKCAPNMSFYKSSYGQTTLSVDAAIAGAICRNSRPIIEWAVKHGALVESYAPTIYKAMLDLKISANDAARICEEFPVLAPVFDVTPLMVIEALGSPKEILDAYPKHANILSMLALNHTKKASTIDVLVEHLLAVGIHHFNNSTGALSLTDLAIEAMILRQTGANTGFDGKSLFAKTLAAGIPPLQNALNSISDLDKAIDSLFTAEDETLLAALEQHGRDTGTRLRFSKLLEDCFDKGKADNLQEQEIIPLIKELVAQGRSAELLVEWALNTYPAFQTEEDSAKLLSSFMLDHKLFAKHKALLESHWSMSWFHWGQQEPISEAVSRMTKRSYTSTSDQFRIYLASTEELVATATTANRLGVIIANCREPTEVVSRLQDKKLRREGMDLIAGQ